MRRFDIRLTVYIGFGAAIALMVLMLSIGFYQVRRVEQDLTNLVEVVNAKTEFATAMRDAIRLRLTSLYRMLSLRDPFERDEELMRFYDYASRYRAARQRLMALPMDARERALHHELSLATRASQPKTRAAVELINEGAPVDAANAAIQAALAGREPVLRGLDQLVALQKAYGERAVARSRIVHQRTLYVIIALAVLAIIGALVIARYVTRYVAASNALLAGKNRRLSKACKQAADATSEKSRFLANISHELRTPLNAIIGYVELLEEDAREEAAESRLNDLQRIHMASTHLLALINDILDISKIESGKLAMHLENFDVEQLVREVCDTVRPLAARNGNVFRLACAADLGSLYGDRLKLQQILYNLLSNACKFTANGEVVLRVAKVGEDQFDFSVKDTGIGIAPDAQKYLFEPFSQLHGNASNEYGGTGLGLAIIHSLCRLMGGDIEVRSVPGEGSEFLLRLPARVVQSEPAAPRRSLPALSQYKVS